MASAAPRTARPFTGHPFRRPSDALWRSEHWRTVADLMQFWGALPWLMNGPRGDGHAVLVLPGMLAADESTAGLRSVLVARGYRAESWGLGPNIGPTRRITDGIITRLHDLHDRTGRPVSLVGWSLGGFLARELSRRFPSMCRLVITLGTPLRLGLDDDPGLTTVGEIFASLRPFHTDFLVTATGPHTPAPVPVPATAIYSKADGVVPWQACLERPGRGSESVEVTASHCGMGFHPGALSVVLDRLRQPEGDWQPYRRVGA